MVSLKNPERFFGRFWRQSNCSGICGPFPALLIRRSMGSSRMQGSVPRRLKVRSGIFANIEYVCVPCRIWRRCCPAAAPSPPGSSRRAGGYSPVLRLTADEMSLPLFPCPKKFTFWDTTLLPRGTFWVRVPRRPARGRPKAVFLLLACCTQEEDAGPAKGAPASVPVTPNYGNPRSRKCPANSAQLPLINYKETNDPEVPISWL